MQAVNPSAEYHSVMSEYPEAVDGYVAYEQPNEPVLKEPHEAKRLAMDLLSAASEARAHQLAESGEVEASDSQDLADQGGDDQGDADPLSEQKVRFSLTD